MNSILLIGAVFVWGMVHSLLASRKVKSWFNRSLGLSSLRFYRLAYNLFSLVSFLPILGWMAVFPGRDVYSVPAPWAYEMVAVQLLAIVLLMAGVLQTDTLAFVGLRQLFERKPQPSRLVVNGLYRFVRHPLYTAGLLFVWMTARMTVSELIGAVALTVYILLGAYFEERKRALEYGRAYLEYRSMTPMLIPGLRFKRDD